MENGYLSEFVILFTGYLSEFINGLVEMNALFLKLNVMC